MDASCKTAKLAERVAALEEKLQRLENFVVEADDDLADDVDELANDDEDDGDLLILAALKSHYMCMSSCLASWALLCNKGSLYPKMKSQGLWHCMTFQSRA